MLSSVTDPAMSRPQTSNPGDDQATDHQKIGVASRRRRDLRRRHPSRDSWSGRPIQQAVRPAGLTYDRFPAIRQGHFRVVVDPDRRRSGTRTTPSALRRRAPWGSRSGHRPRGPSRSATSSSSLRGRVREHPSVTCTNIPSPTTAAVGTVPEIHQVLDLGDRADIVQGGDQVLGGPEVVQGHGTGWNSQGVRPGRLLNRCLRPGRPAGPCSARMRRRPSTRRRNRREVDVDDVVPVGDHRSPRRSMSVTSFRRRTTSRESKAERAKPRPRRHPP